MNKRQQLDQLVQKHDLESLKLPKLKQDKFDFGIDGIIQKIKELFSIESDYELAQWVTPALLWLCIIVLTVYLGLKLMKYLKEDKKSHQKLIIKDKNMVFTSRSSVLSDQIKASLGNKDYKRAMKLLWNLKLQKRDLNRGLTLSDVFKNSKKVEGFNERMFSPDAVATKDDFDQLKGLKFRGRRER